VAVQESQVLPVFGGMQLETAKQGQNEFDFLINCDLSKGNLEARDGWRVIKTPETWKSVDDPDPSVGTKRYEPDTWKTAAIENVMPMGSYLFSAPSGIDYIIAVFRPNTASAAVDPETVKAIVYTTTGHVANLAAGAVTLRSEEPGKPYVFAEFAQSVYFCNGNRIWRWSENETQITDVSQSFYKSAASQDQFAYFTEMMGSSIMVEHLGRMVYAGFSNRQWLVADKTIETDSSQIMATDEATKDGLKLSPDLKSVQAGAAAMFFSDFAEPMAVRPVMISMMPTYRPVTGLASFRKQLIVFTDTEMWVTNAPPAHTRKIMGVGCVSHRTIQQTRDGMLMWLARDGIYAWNGSGLPLRISAPLDRMFNGEDSNFSFPRQQAPAGTEIHIPYIVSQSQLGEASAAVIGSRDTYCVALKGGSAVETNDIIVCCHYPSKRLWFWVSAGLSAGGSEASPTDVVGSAMAGHYTIMGSKIDPDRLFSQAFHCYNSATVADMPKRQATHMAIAVMDRPNIGDQKMTYPAADPVLAEYPFEMVAVSRRFHMGMAVPKLYRQIRLRMYAKRRDDFISTDTNKTHLVFVPEIAPFESVNQADAPSSTDSREFATTVNPWPDEFCVNIDGTYFWQPNPGNTSKGKWQAVGASASSEYHNWVPYQPFDKRVDVRCPSTQFVRVAIRKRVDDESGAPIRIVSMSLVVMIEKGVTR